MNDYLISRLYSMKKIIIYIILILFGISYILLFNSEYYSWLNPSEDSIGGLSLLYFFYNFYSGQDFGFFIIALLLIFPLIKGVDTFDLYNTRSDQFPIVRLGYEKYYRKHLFNSILSVMFFPLILNGVMILIMLALGYKWQGEIPYLVYGYSQEIDFILFNIFQVVGWSVLNIFLMTWSQILNNKYLYGSFLVLFTLFILMTTVAVTFPFSSTSIPIIGDIHSSFILITSPITLLTGGVYSFSSGYSNLAIIVIISFLGYMVLNFALLKFVIKQRKKQQYVYN